MNYICVCEGFYILARVYVRLQLLIKSLLIMHQKSLATSAFAMLLNGCSNEFFSRKKFTKNNFSSVISIIQKSSDVSIVFLLPLSLNKST